MTIEKLTTLRKYVFQSTDGHRFIQLHGDTLRRHKGPQRKIRVFPKNLCVCVPAIHPEQIIKGIRPLLVSRVAVWTLLLALSLAGLTPVLAQSSGDIGATLNTVIGNVVDVIQTITVGLAVLGLSLWALGKLARPVFPQLAQLTANYITEFIIGIVVVFAVSEIVDGVVAAVGGTSP